MDQIDIKFTDSDWEPKSGDSDSHSFYFSIENPSNIPSVLIPDGKVTVNISRSLQTHWDLEREDLKKVLGHYAKDHVISKAEEGSLSTTEEIQLTTYNSTDTPPFDIDHISYIVPKEYPVYIPITKVDDDFNALEYAGKIVDLRDNINALFGESYENRLLSLTQERALLELSKSCTSVEEFTHRVSSLCSLVISIDENAYRKIPKFNPEGKSLEKFGCYLREFFPGEVTESIMKDLSRFNHLRRMYPIHTDRASGVLEAHEHFGIDYPVSDYQDAWNKLLIAYQDVLSRILQLHK